MNDQKQHLETAIQQQRTLFNEISELNSTLAVKREQATKLQGIIEYLNGLGVTLDNPSEETQSTPNPSNPTE